ncbi:MAG: low molecular weight phosphotyrosine protein phosphatase [Gammaproteobacteria bacterium]|nr:low molecular weight phosphotyrosine protein phosphatase [Gammaproteobacteria bacterium]
MPTPPNNPKSILFICTSNVCRGPMAGALFKRRRTTGWGRIVRSAGICGTDGMPVLKAAQDVLNKRGIDLSHHHARMATPHLLPAFDLILAMEPKHREWVEQHVPSALNRTWLLGHWRNLEFQRSMNGHNPDYERIAEDIDQCLTDWIQNIETVRNSETSEVLSTSTTSHDS